MPEIPDAIVDREAWLLTKDLDDRGENLTEFEIEFVDSLLTQLRGGRTLTDKQREVLDQIREERL